MMKQRKNLEDQLGRRPTRIENLANIGVSPDKYFGFILFLITAIVIIGLLMVIGDKL